MKHESSPLLGDPAMRADLWNDTISRLQDPSLSHGLRSHLTQVLGEIAEYERSGDRAKVPDPIGDADRLLQW